jgi:hypothetical protein
MKINWRDVFKFLSGAFFVTAGTSWYFSLLGMSVPFFRIFSTDTGIFVLSWLHAFRPVSDLPLLRVRQKMIWRKSATRTTGRDWFTAPSAGGHS